MQLSPEQQQMLEQQKAQCPFCKIVNGEISAKKIYEDELFLIILDINPAAKGHMLLVPKEHYPIMPTIPPPVLAKLFELVQEASRLCYTAMVTHGSTIFIANGAAAGQQSAHFLMHVIPREKNDGLGALEVPKKIVEGERAQHAQLNEALRHNISILLRQQFGSPADIPPPQPPKKEYIKGIIEVNKPLLDLVLSQPEQFKKLVAQNQQLRELFREKNVDEIIKEIQDSHLMKQEREELKKKTDHLAKESKESALEAKFEEVKKTVDSGKQKEEQKKDEGKEEKREEEREEKKKEIGKKEEKKKEKADLDTIAKLFA